MSGNPFYGPQPIEEPLARVKRLCLLAGLQRRLDLAFPDSKMYRAVHVIQEVTRHHLICVFFDHSTGTGLADAKHYSANFVISLRDLHVLDDDGILDLIYKRADLAFARFKQVSLGEETEIVIDN